MPISRAVKRGAKLIVIDPRPIPLTKKAALWLPVRPGSDGLLALSFLYVMLEEKLYDEEFLREWTNGGLLIDTETGRALTGDLLSSAGKPGQFVGWDGRGVEARPAFDLFKERVKDYAPEKTAPRTGIAPEVVRWTVRLFTATRPN